MGNLIAVHNEKISNLSKVLDLGGWPAPSIAITNSDFDYNEFGEISFLFNKCSVDPEQNSDNLIYEADAYSARFPKILYKFDADKINEVLGTNFSQYEIDNIGQYDFGETVRHIVYSNFDSSKYDYVSERLNECISKKGIKKTNDILKKPGEVKNFDSITEDYNLNTIHKAMKAGKGKEQTNGFSTMNSWKALLSKRLFLFSEIDIDRIVSKDSADELYKNCEQKFKDLCNDLKCKYKGNEYSHLVGKDLNKVRINSSKSTIYKIFKDYDINDDDIKCIKELAKEVHDLPVSYLEAKPNRAINLIEAKAIIIPKDNEKVKELLDNYFSKQYQSYVDNFKIYEYDDNFTRQDCIEAAIKDNPDLSIMEVDNYEQSLDDKLNFAKNNITKSKNRSDIIYEK